MINLAGLPVGAERASAVQGKYLYLESVKADGNEQPTMAVPVSIRLESGRLDNYLMKPGSQIAFDEPMAEVTVKNPDAVNAIDLIMQNGWGRFTPQMQISGGTVTVEPGTKPLTVQGGGGSLEVNVVNTSADPVPVALSGATGSMQVEVVNGLDGMAIVTAPLLQYDLIEIGEKTLLLGGDSDGWVSSTYGGIAAPLNGFFLYLEYATSGVFANPDLDKLPINVDVRSSELGKVSPPLVRLGSSKKWLPKEIIQSGGVVQEVLEFTHTTRSGVVNLLFNQGNVLDAGDSISVTARLVYKVARTLAG